MIKKLILIGGGTVLGLAVLAGTGAMSYVRTSAGYVTDAVKDSVPIEFQIDRARTMIQDLVPEVRRNMHLIANEEVEVARLKEKIDRAEQELAKDKGELLRLQADLTTGKEVYRYAGRNYSPDQVKSDLAGRFDRYKTNEATLGSLQQMYNAREKGLRAARDRLEGMLASKRQLQVEVENLEARLQMVEASQATSQYAFDDGQLGRVKELISNLRTRIDVEEKLIGAEAEFHEEIPLEETSADDIVDQVTEYFGAHQADAKQLAVQ